MELSNKEKQCLQMIQFCKRNAIYLRYGISTKESIANITITHPNRHAWKDIWNSREIGERNKIHITMDFTNKTAMWIATYILDNGNSVDSKSGFILWEDALNTFFNDLKTSMQEGVKYINCPKKRAIHNMYDKMKNEALSKWEEEKMQEVLSIENIEINR